MHGRKLPTPDLCRRDMSIENASLHEGQLKPPTRSGEALMLAQRICQVETMNSNTACPRMELMAEMILKPPTDFSREPRSVKLALKRLGALRRYSERTAVHVSVHRTVDAIVLIHFDVTRRITSSLWELARPAWVVD